jgi:Activator of Hsp90 ATPase homolog 1-like protein
VTFELEPMGAAVKLTITHDDFDPGSKVHAAVSNGWPMILASLKSLLETGTPLTLTSAEAAKVAEEKAIAQARHAAPRRAGG